MKVKLLRKLLRKPYGLAKFRVGRTWYSKIVNFTQDSCEWFSGMYSFNRDLITIEKSAGNKKVYRQSEFVNFEEGFPIIYFDVNSGVPLHFEGDKATSTMPTAKTIQATVKKWIIASELEMMRKQKNKLMLAMMIVVIFSMIGMFVGIYGIMKMMSLETMLQSIQGAIAPVVSG